MVDISELKEDDPDLIDGRPISDDLAAARASPKQGWIILAKNFREKGNSCVAKKDWEGAALSYRQGVDNITMLLHKNVGDEDEPFVVEKTKEEIKKEGLYSDELQALHLALLKNLALAHIQRNEMGKAIEAADLALQINPKDAKALYRKAYALQKRGNENDEVKAVEEILQKMESLKLEEGKETKEVKQGIAKIRGMIAQDRQKTKKLGKSLLSALESKPGLFHEEKTKKSYSPTLTPEERYRRNGEILNSKQAFAIIDKLTDGYQSDFIQDKIRAALKKRNNNPDDREFRLTLADIAMIVQRPILEEYGFQPNKTGLTELISALYDHEYDEDEEGRELKPLLGIAFSSLLCASWKAQRGG